MASVPDDIPWLVEPFIAKGAITEIIGKLKAAGKTTLVLGMIKAIKDGTKFLDTEVTKTKVVYLSEQPKVSFIHALREFGLTSGDVFIVPTADTVGYTWPEVIEIVGEQIRADPEIGMLVIDTLPVWAKLVGDMENSTGAALAAMEPLIQMATSGLAIVLVRHERKSGGDISDTGRGSSAWSGSVDVIATVQKTSGGDKNSRQIETISRLGDPVEMLVSLNRETMEYSLINKGAALAEAKETLLKELGQSMAIPKTIDELPSNGVSRTSLYRAAEEMLGDGLLAREGTGTKGNPYRWKLTARRGEIHVK